LSAGALRDYYYDAEVHAAKVANSSKHCQAAETAVSHFETVAVPTTDPAERRRAAAELSVWLCGPRNESRLRLTQAT